MQRLPHIIPFSEVTKYIYPALILFEQANFIDLINFCYILWVVYTIHIDIVLSLWVGVWKFLCLRGYIEHIYNIGVLMVNIEFMRRGLETGERRALASFYIRFVPSHINSIFIVNTPILYLSCNKICKKKNVI
jgi:hypothetical protein